MDASNLRAEIQNLVVRAEAFVTATPLAADLDRMIEESAEVEVRASGLLSDDDPALGRLRVTLGGLYASRCLRFGWSDGDRDEGLRRFRAGRAGGHLSAETDASAMLLFAVLLVPRAAATFDGQAAGTLGAILDFAGQLRQGGQLIEDLTEMREVLDEIVAARPDDPRVPPLMAYATTLGGVLQLMRGLSDGTGFSMARMGDLIRGMPSAPDGRLGSIMGALMQQGERLEQQLQQQGRRDVVDQLDQPDHDDQLIRNDLAMLVEVTVPGSLTPAEFRSLITGYADKGDSRSTAIAAIGRFAAASRTNDPGEMDQALRHLRDVAGSPEAPELSWLFTSVYPGLLALAADTHGNIGDAAKALGLYEHQAPPPPAPIPAAEQELGFIRATLGTNLRLSEAIETDDEEALDGLLAELLEARPPTDAAQSEWAFLHPLQLALAKLSVSVRRQDTDMAREAQALMRTALDKPMPTAVRTLMEAAWSSTHMITAVLERQPTEIADAVDSARGLLSADMGSYDGPVQTRLGIASGLMTRYLLTEGPAKDQALGEAIDVLEQAEAALTERTGSRIAGRVLWSLADALRTRHDPALDDNRRAVALTRDSLGMVADDVLLQLNAEHGLRAARTGALRGLRAAGWALEDHRVQDAIECLELGRALVLRSIATAGSVPDRLRAAGETELAEQWESSMSRPIGTGPGAGDQVGTVVGEAAGDLDLPSDLRRRALAALRMPDRRDLPIVATPPQIARHLDAAGVDAVAYLLPGAEGADGTVLMIRRDGSTQELPLPGRGPLVDYLDASAKRYQRLRGQDTTRDLSAVPRWEVSLDELCAWAGASVLDPLIAALPEVPTPESPARVVLIPCGRLGLVPWHAARISATPALAGLSRPPRACDLLVISYAASADELVRSLSRGRKPYDTDPVLVVDPSRTLPYAEEEAAAVRQAYLPGARLLGAATGGPVEAAGTPEQVHIALAGDEHRDPASMVQIIAHGTASTRPTASRLLLARPAGPRKNTDAASEYLTVADIVDASRPGAQDRFSALVILDCCETDLSSRDHDEALTLTTAFVARGAVDAIGSRWAVDDWSAAVCMVVFHHYLAAGSTPAEALRAAQRWMLDPDREPIAAVSGYLLAETRTPLDDVWNWAPFIHQGNAGTPTASG
ncbi:hypothetical protein ABIA35_006391 [Catenulispora sp. MAP12-49]|uniref:CHAT domain-containing protein n=1 Tax=Catenulispora sp. MAP12-49 TaxID=3156302 RepID=UPI003519388E